MRKRLLSALLSFAMVLSAVPVSADDIDIETNNQAVSSVEENAGAEEINDSNDLNSAETEGQKITVPVSIRSEDGVKLLDSKYELSVWISTSKLGSVLNTKNLREEDLKDKGIYANYSLMNSDTGELITGLDYSVKITEYFGTSDVVRKEKKSQTFNSNQSAMELEKVVGGGEYNISFQITGDVVADKNINYTIKGGEMKFTEPEEGILKCKFGKEIDIPFKGGINGNYNTYLWDDQIKKQWYVADSLTEEGVPTDLVYYVYMWTWRIKATESTHGKYYYCKVSNYGNEVYSPRVQLIATHNVNFYKNYGDDSTTPSLSVEVDRGSKYYIPTTTEIIRPGYTLLGWATTPAASTARWKAGDLYPSDILSDVNLYAVWKETVADRIVTYDYATNGGTSSTKRTDTVPEGETADLTPTARKVGYDFVGWNTDKNAKEGLTSYIPNGDVTLYAIFKKAYNINLHTNANGSRTFTVSAEAYNTDTSASYKTLVNTEAETAGYGSSLIGWRTDDEAKEPQYNGNVLNTSSNVDLYAVYEKDLLVVYDGYNTDKFKQYVNASGKAESKTIMLASAPENDTSKFDGWSTKQMSETKEYSAGEEITINSNIHLYPVWAKILEKTTTPAITESNVKNGKQITLTADSGAEIYYTTDGSEPTKANKVYSSPINLNKAGNITIKAMAVKSGFQNSDISSKIITVESAGIVNASPASGQYSSGEQKYIALNNINGAEIYYTTDGSNPNPDNSSQKYSGNFSITVPTIVKAIAVKEGCSNSDIFTYTYYVQGAAAPVDIKVSNIADGKSVILTSETSNAKIYYTTNGTEPTETSTAYTNTINFKEEGVYQIKAIAVLNNAKSPVVTNTVSITKAAMPLASKESGNAISGTKIRLSSNENDGIIYYTTNGSEPDLNSSVYSSEIELTKNNGNEVTIKAITAKSGFAVSDTSTFTYNLKEAVAMPQITVENNNGVKTVTMSCETEGADIYYTTDGTSPGLGKTEYTTPLVLSKEGNYIIKAVAVKNGSTDSQVKTLEFQIKKSAVPVSNEPDGEKNNGTLITLSANGRIYYKINGRDLTEYTSPIKLNEPMTINAYAIEDGCLPSDDVTFNYTVKRITSGTDGAVTWTFNNNGGILTLMGNTSIRDYSQGETPWYPLRAEITKVIIDDGITGIGKNAFDGLYNMEQVSIAESVGAIGENSFSNCTKLPVIEFSNKLTGISNKAFENCKTLTQIIVPPNVRRIGQGAFEGCTSLRELTVPFIGGAGTTTEPDEVFAYIFNNNVPESLKNITVTNETLIPANAFKNLRNVENITVNENVQTIKESAFEGCISLKGFNIPFGVSRIEESTFKDCVRTENIIVPDSVQYIGASAFESCESLKAVNIPKGITELYNNTFKNCASLTNVTVPDTVLNAGTEIFNGCSSINTIKLPFVGANANAGTNEAVTDGIFGYWFGISDNGIEQGGIKYAVPDSIKNVEITNPSRGSIIPSNAFINCNSIETIKIDGGRIVGNNVFKNCINLKSLVLPNSISQSIGIDILAGCKNIKELTVPFIGDSRTSNKTDKSVLGYFFGKTDNIYSGTEQDYTNSNSAVYDIPDSLEKVNVTNAVTIPFGAFQNCDYLKEVSINTSGTVDQWAFYNCEKLEKIKLPTDLNIIETEAFANCVELSTVNIPNNAKRIGDNAFYGDYKLSRVVIPKSVNEIDTTAFNKADNTVIYCYTDSFAHNYAQTNNIEFKLLDAGDTSVFDIDLEKEIVDGKVEYILDKGNRDNVYGIAYIVEYDTKGAVVNVVQEECVGGGKQRIKTNKIENPSVVEIKAFIWNQDNMRPLSKSVSIE